MIARVNKGLVNKRLFSAEEGQEYCSLGRLKFREFADRIGATKKFGTRVLFDRAIIDRALDSCTDLAE